MKISNMTAKTSLEVQDTDIIVIEDGEDTKHITVGDLKEYMLNTSIKKETKLLINETLDNIIKAIESVKYIVSESVEFMMATWIGSTSGNIQIALKDVTNDHWLTNEEIFNLLLPDENGIATKAFSIKVLVAEVFEDAESYTILDFNTEHENAHEVNAVLSDNNAGFIKAHFEGLTQNEIAGITYDDIAISLPETEEYRYLFTGDEASFANAVPYVE